MDPRGASASQAQVEAFGRRHRTGLVTLVFTDMVGSTALKQQLGDHAGAQLIEQHHSLVRSTLKDFADGEELSTAGDSFFLVFATPSAGAKFALVLQQRLRELSRQAPVPVQDRLGLHLGEVLIQEADQQRAKDLIGLNVDLGARVMGLAQGGQVLLTRAVFDSARQALKGEDIPGVGPLNWLNHGLYQLKGIEESVEICEVGEVGVGPLRSPATTEKARRVEAPEGEAVLGWRPAVGQAVPNTQWVLEKKLGEGGFGEVWLGRHQKLKERRVFKFCFRADRVRSLKREMTLFRVLKERVGDHPNIVRLLEVYFEEPPFYVVMDHVEGHDLRTWCEQQGGAEKVPLETKLEIVAQIADALQAAHDAGVIHRDVKPANILVSRWGETPSSRDSTESPKGMSGLDGVSPYRVQAKLTDFGIGQVVSEEALKGVTRAGFTQTIVADSSSSQTGSQLYMAPELLAGKPASTRSDIYSLGVVLYQLLAGDFSRPVTTDWAKQVAEPLLREDLALCFAGQPQERFAGAGQLGKNLRALPQRQAARAAEEAEQTARERAAYRRGVVRTAALAILLVAGFAGLSIYGIRTAREEARQRDLARGSQYSAEMNLAQQAYAEGKVARALSLLEKHIPVSEKQEDLRGFEWRYLWRLCQEGDALHTFRFDTNPVAAVAFSADGRLVTCASDGAVRVLDVAAQREMANFPAKDKANTVAVSANGEVVAARLASGTVRLWRLGASSDEITISDSSGPSRLALSPDGKTLAIVGAKRVRLWDVAGRHEASALPWTNGTMGAGNTVFSPDGRWLASVYANHVALWNVAEKRELAPLENAHTSYVPALVFSPDGQILATCSWDTTIKLWDVPSRRLLATLLGHGSEVRAVTFSPDGRTLASGAADEAVKLWDVGARTNAVLKATLKGHVAAVNSLAFSPDGGMLASGSEDGAVKLWPIGRQASPDLLKGHTDWAFSVAISPDDQTLASAGFDGFIRLWDLRTGAAKSVIPPVSPYDIFTVAFSPDGATLATAEGRWRAARLRNVSNPGPALARLRPVANPDQVRVLSGFYTNGTDMRAAVFSPDGKKLAIVSGRWVRFCSLPEGRVITNLCAGGGGSSPCSSHPMAGILPVFSGKARRSCGMLQPIRKSQFSMTVKTVAAARTLLFRRTAGSWQ